MNAARTSLVFFFAILLMAWSDPPDGLDVVRRYLSHGIQVPALQSMCWYAGFDRRNSDRHMPTKYGVPQWEVLSQRLSVSFRAVQSGLHLHGSMYCKRDTLRPGDNLRHHHREMHSRSNLLGDVVLAGSNLRQGRLRHAKPDTLSGCSMLRQRYLHRWTVRGLLPKRKLRARQEMPGRLLP